MFKFAFFIICALISIPLVLAYSPVAGVDLFASIQGSSFTASGQFIAGAGDPALDGYDQYDGRMVSSPGYSIPFYSVLNSEYFMIDYKATLQSGQPKSWDITQQGSRQLLFSGDYDETITWDISNLPSNVEAKFIDYGTDASRTTKVTEINLRSQSSYTVSVHPEYGDYRYFRLTLEKTQAACTESWSCTSWSPSVCPQSGIQTQSCQDINNCGTTNNKPQETRSCTYQCTENWDCTGWSACQDGTQTQSCTDLNSCGTTVNKPSESQLCTASCTENWQCSAWSSCSGGVETRSCTDSNGCGTSLNLPDQTRSCSEPDDSGSARSARDSFCIPSWTCSTWGACANNKQARTCIDINHCGSLDGKPTEQQLCQASNPKSGTTIYDEQGVVVQVQDTAQPIKKSNEPLGLLLILLVFEIIVVFTLIAYLVLRK